VVRFIEVINQTDFNPKLERTSTPKFSMGEVWINPQYVVSIREALGYQSLLRKGLLPEDLDASHTFTTVTTTNGDRTESHVVMGNPQAVAGRLNPAGKTLLKG
jgi:hypothetical protein